MEIKKDEVIALERELIEGIRTSDIEFLNKILHDDLLFIAPNGEIITKAIDLASHKSGQMVVEKITSTIEEIKIIGNIATVIIVYDTKGKMLDTPIDGKFRYIRIWKRFGKDLKVIGGSCFKL